MLEAPYYGEGNEIDPASVVYFVQAESGGPVKIGTSTRVGLASRLASIQTGHPERLVITRTVAGDARYERQLHDHFGAYRLAGEWFEPMADLVALAEAKAGRVTVGFSEVRQREAIFRAGRSAGFLDAQHGLGYLVGEIVSTLDPNAIREMLLLLAQKGFSTPPVAEAVATTIEHGMGKPDGA